MDILSQAEVRVSIVHSYITTRSEQLQARLMGSLDVCVCRVEVTEGGETAVRTQELC